MDFCVFDTQAPKDMKGITEKGTKSWCPPQKKFYSAWTNYGISKMSNIFFTREFNKRFMKETGFSFLF